MSDPKQEPPRGQWATEAYDFMRLHGRVQNRFYGLLLMLMGWAGLLWIVSTLGTETAGTQLLVPYYSLSAGWTSTTVAPTDVLIPGAVLIFLAWLVISQLHTFITWPLAAVLRVIGVLLLTVALVAAGIVLIPTLLVTFPIALQKKRKWEDSLDQNKLTEVKKALGDRYIVFAFEQAKFDPAAPWSWLFGLYRYCIGLIVPDLRIGLAPIESFSLGEEHAAARLPLQVFAEAASRLNDLLARRPSEVHVDVINLPLVIRVRSGSSANRIRRWLGFDALLWGTFVGSEADRVWVNVTSAPPDSSEGPGRKRERERAHGPLDEFEFPRRLLVRTDASYDAFAVLLLAISNALEARGRRLRVYPRFLDRVFSRRFRLQEDVQQLLLDCALGAGWADRELTGEQAATAAVINWAKKQISDYTYGWNKRDRASLPAIRSTIEKCLRLAPDNADVRYLAALLLFSDDKIDKAKDVMAAGISLDRVDRLRDWSYLTVIAGDAIRTAEAERSDARALCLGNAAVYATLAMHVDAAASRRSILRDLKGYRITEEERDEPQMFSVAWRAQQGGEAREPLLPVEKHLLELVGIAPSGGIGMEAARVNQD